MKFAALVAAALMTSAPAFAMAQTSTQPMQTQDDSMATPSGAMQATQTQGGIMPATPPMSQQPTADQQVIFKPSESPDQAFPPPPPKASYPICKKGQTDGCRQRGGR
ncbi:hypothetical protein GCM10023219_01900 [Stakelama sediminis]|uniref:Uncharacterized protein n=1 Tax=Stakelama sediminis TaxID=463200 RepID=A0A840YZW5_9SPHN|nr:hypothetical protein [Stakelama sediminis]MBB5719371.1 hypothetical protein [Stakelama sediminis]